MLRRLVAVAFSVALAASAHASGFNGPWNGTIAGAIRCYPSGSAIQSYKLLVTLTESNGALTGSGTMAGRSDSCSASSPLLSDPVTLNGSISGSIASGTISTPHMSGQFKATVAGSVLSLAASFGVMDVSGALVPGSTPVAPAPLTGTWSGKYTSLSACNGHPVSSSGALQFFANESSGSFSGAILVNVALFDCQRRSAVPIALPFTGTAGGNVFGGTFAVPFAGREPGAITGSITGDSMAVNVSAGDTNAHATLVLSSSEAPATDLTGAYAGGHTSSFQPCGTLPTVTYAGALSASFTQIGSSVFGTITSTGNKTYQSTPGGGCQIVDAPPETDIVSGRVSGTSIAGVLIVPSAAVTDTIPFIGSINGNTITGAVRAAGSATTFIMTRAGFSPPPPKILSFAATPKIMKAGDSATLSWSTLGATSVTIDRGIGTVVGSGTRAVAPAASSVYTLTASSAGGTATARAFIEVLTGAAVNVHGLPRAMLQLAGTAGASTSYTLTNSGATATAIALAQSGDFFTQSPPAFTLAPGASQTITITATAQPAGAFVGTSNPSGFGVPAALRIPIRLLSVAPSSGNVTAEPDANRIDVSAESGTSPTGSIRFRNRGTARLTGILNSDEPWLVPQPGTVTIDPGQTATLTFSIDRSQRPDAAKLAGSVAGSLSLSFLRSGGTSFAKQQPANSTATIPSVSLVKVVDTVKPTTSVGGIPALGAGEVGLLIPGVGHTTGTSGASFVSDVSILNALSGDPVDDVKLYYTPANGNASTAAQSTSLPGLEGQANVAIADVVKNVFNGNDEVGTLHIRSKDADKLAVAATVLSTGTANGTFGNTIPVFRTDRSTPAGSALVLTALRKDAMAHTNLYVQETSGTATTVQMQFLGADGSAIGSRPPDSIGPFQLLQLVDVVPQGAVAAVITNTAGGMIAAYATPVDDASGDTWAITDWSTQLGYTATESVIVPVAGSVHGANDTFYRTDVTITNRGTAQASGTLRYIARTGEQFEHDIALGPKQSAVLSDVVSGTFGVTGDSMGYLVFMPDTGTFALASRTFATVGANPGTFGTGVPALGFSSALRTGDSRPIAGLSDAARTTVTDGTPGTFRTNFALMETAGAPVTVRVTFRFTFPAGEKAQGSGSAYRDYDLNPNAFLLLNSIASEILGAARLTFGDLTNVEADFQVLSGSGAAVLFTSSVDNATGDSILRSE